MRSPIGSAVFEGAFSPTKGALRSQVTDVLRARPARPSTTHRRRWSAARGRTRRRRRDRRSDPLDRRRRDALGAEKALVDALDVGPRLAVVCDPATHSRLGAPGAAALDAQCLQPRRESARRHGERWIACAARPPACDALIAVGSGTINDLCKYAAARDGKPYAVFATAPSMNGYTSVNAAITVDGHKHTLPRRRARGVFVDLEVLARAPVRMIRGRHRGLDLPAHRAARLEAFAHACSGHAYREAPFALLAPDEPAWLDAP
jgi:glycerol-1-phosphate dehydrogenase [NAD(P)+]